MSTNCQAIRMKLSIDGKIKRVLSYVYDKIAGGKMRYGNPTFKERSLITILSLKFSKFYCV